MKPRPSPLMLAVTYEGTSRLKVDDDHHFAALSAKGDARAFQELYERHYGRVYALARGVLLDHDEAQDAVQEVFLTIHKNIARFDGRAQFSTWLYRVALNRCIQQARKLRPRRAVETALADQQELSSASSSDQTVDHGVDAALAKLDPSDRAVLVLFYWEDQSLKEIGEALGCSANAAKTRLFRARERVRAYLQTEDDR